MNSVLVIKQKTHFKKSFINIFDVLNLRTTTIAKVSDSKKNKTDEYEISKMDKSACKNYFFDKIITKLIN